MKLKDLSQMFNRAAGHVFAIKKTFFLFLALIVFGLIFLSLKGIATDTLNWWRLFLAAIPFFLLIAFLMATGVFLVKAYVLEREDKPFSVKETFSSSAKFMLKAAYFALPLFLAFIVLWVTMGIFILLKSIPYLGPFLGVILAFVPYVSSICILLLFFISLLFLFFLTPLLAFNETVDRNALIGRLRADLFTHILLLGSAFFPVWIVWLFASRAITLTFAVYSINDSGVEMALQSLFMLIPFAAVMALPLTFFFNFATESYLMTKAD